MSIRRSLPDPASGSEGGQHPWPYDLRFYDPPPEGIRVRVQLPGPELPAVFISDYTVGLVAVPGLPHLDRSPAHSAELVVVGQQCHLTPHPRQE